MEVINPATERCVSLAPRADAAQSTGASMPTGVQDVRWREVAPASEAADDARHP